MAGRKLGCVDITCKMCELTFRRVTNNTGTESVVTLYQTTRRHAYQKPYRTEVLLRSRTFGDYSLGITIPLEDIPLSFRLNAFLHFTVCKLYIASFTGTFSTVNVRIY